MSEQPSPQETQRNRRYNDQTSYSSQQQQPPSGNQGQVQPARQPQPRRYAQGQQGRPRYSQGNAPQNPQGGYPQQRPPQYPPQQQTGYPQRQAAHANQPYPPQGQANPNQPYPPQRQTPYYQQAQRPAPVPSSGTSPLEVIGKLVGGFFKVLAYPFVKIAQIVGRVFTIILEEMVRTVVSFIMGLVMIGLLFALIVGYAVALVSVDFNFVAAVPEMFRMFGQLVGVGG
ncbi:MAG: hypothetical protein AAFV98_12765 [Chloroflexota bacterium]